MKIKLDENLPVSLVRILSELGHDTETVPQEGMAGKQDPQIWEDSKKANRFLITQDLDFSDMRQFAPGSHPGILLLRLREPGQSALRNRIQTIFENEKVEEWKGCLVISTDRKIRIKRPKTPSAT